MGKVHGAGWRNTTPRVFLCTGACAPPGGADPRLPSTVKGMPQIVNRKFYTYAQAAERVQRTTRTIMRWRREGMPMTWDVHGARIVAHGVLLEQHRKALDASPAHQYRMRRIRAEADADDFAYWDDSGPGAGDVVDAGAPPRRAAVQRRGPAPPPGGRPRAPRPAPRRPAAPGPGGARACAGDARFAADMPAARGAAGLAAVCAGCALLAQCAEYAREARPAGGFWPSAETVAALAAGLPGAPRR